jgi:enoyl-CoA hydratase/carnithine racemase
MPECGIGLIPDVGGSMILAHAPGRLGEYLSTTATRMGPADAIYAGFADVFLPEAKWADAKAAICATGLAEVVGETPPAGQLAGLQAEIDQHFGGEGLADIMQSLRGDDSAFAAASLKAMGRNAPLAMACAVEILHRLGDAPGIRAALGLEYRFTYRAMEHSDFLEGIRAAIIDKDRNPKWQHKDVVPAVEMSKMLMPLGADALRFEEDRP